MLKALPALFLHQCLTSQAATPLTLPRLGGQGHSGLKNLPPCKLRLGLGGMALAAAWRRGPAGAWRGLQAAALVAERLQLQLAPSICSELEQQQQQLWQGGGRAACSSSAWQAAPSWPRAACSGCSFAAGPALVRWHSTSAGRQKDPEKDSQEKQAAAGGILEVGSAASWMGARDCSATQATTSAVFACLQAFSRAGWSRREVLNIPNGLSMLRLLSGPVIASWILAGQVSGWAPGHRLARALSDCWLFSSQPTAVTLPGWPYNNQ